MLCDTTDTRRTSRFIVIMVLVLMLSHRTTGGGSWKRLERMFIQDHNRDDKWDQNRIIFPDEVQDYTKSSWRSTTTPRYDDGRACEDRCQVSREYSPVCGSDGVTYQNVEMLQCARRCGVAVELQRPSPCSSNVPTTTSPVFTTSTSPFLITSTRNEGLEECIRTCPSTPEYNPVCGSNRVTYPNVGKMRCAKICGVDVYLWRQAPCSTLSPTTTVAPIRPDRNVAEVCITNCPATPHYNPVCGSDDITYYNFGKLECAKLCGVDVRVHYQGRCKTLRNRQEFVSSDSTSEEDYDEENFDPRYHPRNYYWK